MTFSITRGFHALLVAVCVGLSAAPIAAADAEDNLVSTGAAAAPQSTDAETPAQLPDAAAPVADDGGADPSVMACKSFSGAMNFAASNYEDFAYDSAGNGNTVNWSDPNVQSSNFTGRTALRMAAGTAMNAADTPGLDPAISEPMRSWSMRATKLLIIMGLHAGGERLNNTATDMNTDARNVQMVCAAAGTAV
ncbi:hypothetical protein [Mycobacterium sp. 155]|uniref:hypothetical protein n=1 Tax=Mycobacterium sp. 155 TaxID=1157943 RepID=UPI00036B1BA3|nr:hypothetical protein [Mycobacterium sp. 155]